VEWGDLAEIDNKNSPDRDNLWQYWKDLVDYYIDMGIDGFRCDAAYQVPNELWKVLIRHTRRQKKNCLYLAESLGCTIEETMGLVKAGFDYVFNSSKYWDFTEDWALDQHNLLHKHRASSISFPESHDTTRLAREYGEDVRQAKLRYLFAAVFSAGVMIPCGFEYGFKKKPDVKTTTPDDWEEGSYDITSYIKQANNLKIRYPVFQEDSEIRLISEKEDPVLTLLMISRDQNGKALVFLNKDRQHYKRFYHPHLHTLMQSEQIEDISLEDVMEGDKPDEIEYWLKPGQIKIFYSTPNEGKRGGQK